MFDAQEQNAEKLQEVDYDFPDACPGKSIVITVNRSGYARVMDDENYQLYRNGEDCRAFQGHITSSPYRFKIPYGQHWHAVIDPHTLGGLAQFTVRLMDDAIID